MERPKIGTAVQLLASPNVRTILSSGIIVITVVIFSPTGSIETFWNVTQPNLVVHRRFGGKYFLHLRGPREAEWLLLSLGYCLLPLLFDPED